MAATATTKLASARGETPHTERARFVESGNAFAIQHLRVPAIEQLHHLLDWKIVRIMSLLTREGRSSSRILPRKHGTSIGISLCRTR